MSTVSPSWDELHETANGQAGHFTTQQAASAGFSTQLLYKHVQSGNLARQMRGVYRLSRFPPSEHEELVVLWLWSGQEAVFSHETALHLQELSDALPARIHLTLPISTRQQRIPEGVVVHLADIPARERQWLGPVPITSPTRTVLDIATAHGDADLVAQAIDQGIRRGLFRFAQVAPAGNYVASAQGVGTLLRPEGVDGLDASGEGSWVGSSDPLCVRHFSGVCSERPPADWPALAASIAQEYGAPHLRAARYFPSRTMLLEFAWRLERAPRESAVASLYKKLTQRFSWTSLSPGHPQRSRRPLRPA